MPYKISSEDNQKIVFTRESAGCAMALFIGVGSVFLLIGIGFNLLSSSFEMPFVLFKILFPLMGAGAIAAGIFAPKMAQSNPELITFDHNKAVVTIDMTKEGDLKGHIRYDEIEKFDIYTERQSSTSSGRNTISTTTYYYHVFLRKKDGGEWFLTRSGSLTNAQSLAQKLTSSINTTKTSNFSPKAFVSEKISKDEKMDKTAIQWQNEVGIAGPIFLVVFAIVFLGVFWTIFTSGSGISDGFGATVGGFIFLVFCLVMFFSVKKMVKDATTRYEIVIGKDKFDYNEISKSTGAVKNVKSIPLKEVYSISYSFSPAKNYGNAGLTILTEQESAQLRHDRDHPLDALKNIFSNSNMGIKISITALNPVECLQLESWLQAVIKKKGGVDVL